MTTGFIVFVVVLGLAALGLVLMRRHRGSTGTRRTLDDYAALVDTHQLTRDDASDPSLRGHVDGHAVSIRMLSERQLDDEVPFLFVNLRFARPLDADLLIRAEDLDALDGTIDARGREALTGLLRTYPQVQVDREGMVWSARATTTDAPTLGALLRHMARTASALAPSD